MNTSYRPHNPGNDYYDKGIYLITLVVGSRDRLLGELNMDTKQPGVVLSPLGEAVREEWNKTSAIQASKGRKIKLRACVCMPDHFHGVIEVEERMDKCLGDIIQYFKSACTSRYRKLTGAIVSPSWGKKISNMGKEARAAAYLTVSRIYRPLFDDNYDDTICLRLADGSYDQRHLAAMVNYVSDNPRRAIIMKLRPQFMQRCMHLRLATGHNDANGLPQFRDYAAFGNLFLLRWARKVQVFCHRKARYNMLTEEEKRKAGNMLTEEEKQKAGNMLTEEEKQKAGNMLTEEEKQSAGYTKERRHAAYGSEAITSIPYEQTQAFREDCRRWKMQLMEGATVIVTPGISKGERIIKDRCIERGYPLIHIQKETISRYWKPEQSRFEACTNGSLLIIAPWQPEQMGEVNGIDSTTDYSIFHNLNKVAEEICAFEGKAIASKWDTVPTARAAMLHP